MGPWRRGSASRSQREGRGFESRRLHQTVPPVARLTRHPCGQTLIMHWKKRWEGPSRPDGPVVAQPPRKRQVAGSNPARGSREASAMPAVRRTGRQARGVMDASLCVGGAMAGTAVSKTVDPGSSPGRRATPPSSFWPIGASAPGEDGDGFGMWRSRQRARLGAARPRVRVPPFRRGRTRQDRACPHEGGIRRMARTRQPFVPACRRVPPQTAWRGLASPRKPSAPRLRGSACMTPPRTRGLRPGPWATPPPSGMPEVPAAAVRGPAMRRGGRMRTPDTKGAHHVRSGRT